MNAAVDALVRAYQLDTATATDWVTARHRLLEGRSKARPDARAAASSGCAARGVRTHGTELAVAATAALQRLDRGLAPFCESCQAILPFERLDAAPMAVHCTACAPGSQLDTRWCR